MTEHPTVIEAGPGVIRRICCGTAAQEGFEHAAALESIDEPVVLVDETPVAIGRVWRTALRSLLCGDRRSVLVVHPSWWSASRVELIVRAATDLADEVDVLPRARLLAAAAADAATVVTIEVAAGLVAITGAVTEARTDAPGEDARAVAEKVIAQAGGFGAAVRIDSPRRIAGAQALAKLIADQLTGAGIDAEVVDETRLATLAAATKARKQPAPRRTINPRIPVALACVALLGAAVVGAGMSSRHGSPAVEATPTAFLVEGRVALQVPAQWPVRRVTDGPGSARVEVVSPSDPQAMLHVTQSFPVGALDSTAAALKDAVTQANAAEQSAVFVDFNPSGNVAGKPAVTYRELREGHHVDWTVLVAGAVRISIGCQSRPDGADAIRTACEQAVSSARAVG